jgi:hypothetical protein
LARASGRPRSIAAIACPDSAVGGDARGCMVAARAVGRRPHAWPRRHRAAPTRGAEAVARNGEALWVRAGRKPGGSDEGRGPGAAGGVDGAHEEQRLAEAGGGGGGPGGLARRGARGCAEGFFEIVLLAQYKSPPPPPPRTHLLGEEVAVLLRHVGADEAAACRARSVGCRRAQRGRCGRARHFVGGAAWAGCPGAERTEVVHALQGADRRLQAALAPVERGARVVGARGGAAARRGGAARGHRCGGVARSVRGRFKIVHQTRCAGLLCGSGRLEGQQDEMTTPGPARRSGCRVPYI